jgi:hypothetical protein
MIDNRVAPTTTPIIIDQVYHHAPPHPSIRPELPNPMIMNTYYHCYKKEEAAEHIDYMFRWYEKEFSSAPPYTILMPRKLGRRMHLYPVTKQLLTVTFPLARKNK